MTDRALVAIDSAQPAGDRDEVIQRPGGPAHTVETRRTPALYGIGFLEAVETGSGNRPFHLGAFNRQRSILESVSAAFATELGVSTDKHCSRPTAASSYPRRCRPDITAADLKAVAAYLRLLAPPAPPSRPTIAAREAFAAVGCHTCHVDTQVTGPANDAQFASKVIRPFSDLRAHSIGTSERGPVRTTPLWGLNSFGPPYLHDGSAQSIEAAILAHRGEADQSRRRYEQLSVSSKAALLDYLRSF